MIETGVPYYCAHCNHDYFLSHDINACRRLNELEQRIARLESANRELTWRQYEEGIASQQARAGYVD